MFSADSLSPTPMSRAGRLPPPITHCPQRGASAAKRLPSPSHGRAGVLRTGSRRSALMCQRGGWSDRHAAAAGRAVTTWSTHSRTRLNARQAVGWTSTAACAVALRSAAWRALLTARATGRTVSRITRRRALQEGQACLIIRHAAPLRGGQDWNAPSRPAGANAGRDAGDSPGRQSWATVLGDTRRLEGWPTAWTPH